MVSITHHRSGRIDIYDTLGRHVATVEDEADVAPHLDACNVRPDDTLTVQTRDGKDWKVPARGYLNAL